MNIFSSEINRLTSKVEDSFIEKSPFPHTVIENFFSKEVISLIIKEFDLITKTSRKTELNNKAENFSVRDLESNIHESQLAILLNHLQSEGFKKVLYKKFSNLFPSSKKFSILYPSRFSLSKSVILSNLRLNTPTKIASSFRGPHLDNPKVALVGLIYMRDEEDESKGGNFQMFSSKKRRLRFNQEISGETRGFDERELILEKEIEYKKNTALFFPASKDSIHAVSKREETVFFRKAIGIDITCESYRSYDENSM